MGEGSEESHVGDGLGFLGAGFGGALVWDRKGNRYFVIFNTNELALLKNEGIRLSAIKVDPRRIAFSLSIASGSMQL